tara:strand:- start:221 stop:616 length:396 start_codon:yes stop_codon:yes gene_type:complete
MKFLKEVPRTEGRSWTIPDDLRRYIQFNAKHEPICTYAEALCVKYHTLAVFSYVLGLGDETSWAIASAQQLDEQLEKLWSQLVLQAGIQGVNPDTINTFLRGVLEAADAAQLEVVDEWVERLNELLPGATA